MPRERSGRWAEGVDDAVLVLAQLLGGDEVGRRGQEEAVGSLGGLLTLARTLSSGPAAQ